MSGISKNLVQRRLWNKKDFLNFVFFEELSRFKVLCEHGIFGIILFTFSVIFVQIKIFSIKILIQIYISLYKIKQFFANRRKG